MNARFITYFDSHYACQGIAMLESLRQWHPQAAITVCGLDERIAHVLRARFGKTIDLLAAEEIWKLDPRLAAIRPGRTFWEFFATQKPALVNWVQENQTAPGDWTIYVDSDLFFFGSLAGLIAGLADTSIALSPHRFNPGTEHLSAYGDYNAGFGIWRNDAEGRRCLREWCDDCLAWCFNHAEGGRFMNQGHLTAWPARYRRAAVLRHPGVNLAPWNLGSHRLRLDGSTVLVNEQPLLCFHFSSLSRTPTGDWQTFYTYDAMHQPPVQTGIYAPYLQALERISRELSASHDFSGLGSVRAADPDIPMLTMQARA